MMTDTMQLGDIPVLPDLSSFATEQTTAWENGWYKGQILETRSFQDRNGNDRVFNSSDEPAQRSGRNIRLQVELTRADGRKMNLTWLVNYNPEDLTPDVIKAVTARKEEGGQYGELFRQFMTLQRMSKFQQIAGAPLTKNGDGGLTLTSLFGKEAYFRLADDDRDARYKEIKDTRPITHKPAKVL